MKKFLIIGIAIVVFAAIATGLYVWLGGDEPQTTNTNQATNTTTTAGSTTVTTPTTTDTTTAPATAAGENEETVTRIARTFIERYGSYNSRNDYENLTSVFPFMTTGFQAETEDFIATSKASADTDAAYYGISTNVLTIALSEFTAGNSATVTATTSRIETRDNNDATQFTQPVDITLTFDGSTWKVSAVQWK